MELTIPQFIAEAQMLARYAAGPAMPAGACNATEAAFASIACALAALVQIENEKLRLLDDSLDDIRTQLTLIREAMETTDEQP